MSTDSRPIIRDKFVPKVERTAAHCPGILSRGSVALVRAVACDILSDLLDVAMKKYLEI